MVNGGKGVFKIFTKQAGILNGRLGAWIKQMVERLPWLDHKSNVPGRNLMD